MKPAIALTLAAALAAQNRAPANSAIQRERMEASLHFLAGDSMRGRLTGTPEAALSAAWVESQFRRAGLKPVRGLSGFQQRYNLTWSTLGHGNRLRAALGAAVSEPAVLDGFMPLFFSPNASVKAGVVFAGYGIEAPSIPWNDLRSLPLGRVVLMLEGEPGADDPASPFDGVVTSVHADPLRKALNAQARGAAGVLFVSLSEKRTGVSGFASMARGYWPKTPPHLKRYALTTEAEKLRIPVASISAAVAQHLFADREIAGLLKLANTPAGLPSAVVGRGEVELETRVDHHVIDDWNVVSMIEGSDPALKDECVIVCAHYDHNGVEDTRIYNGADDNGSGTVALADIAEAYAIAAREGKRPRRTEIFASWGSEERCCGPLLGAWAWAANPAWPLNKTVAVLNMDMIGRSEHVPEGGGSRFNGLAVQTAESNQDSVNIIGTSYSPDMRKAVTAANADSMTLRFRYDNNRSNLLRRSDHWVFLNHGVPALWFHTGLHPDYHTVFDRPERIDYRKMERVARLVHQASWDLANADAKPVMLPKRPVPPLD